MTVSRQRAYGDRLKFPRSEANGFSYLPNTLLSILINVMITVLITVLCGACPVAAQNASAPDELSEELPLW
jgi:hypothetical protein